MNLLNKYIEHAYMSIDRIELSVPVLLIKPMFRYLYKYCMHIHLETDEHDLDKYNVEHFIHIDSLITIKIPFKKPYQPRPVNPRFYVTVSDADETVQLFTKEMCVQVSEGCTTERFRPLIMQVEVAIDLYTADKKRAESGWRYLGRHYFTIGSRTKSYGRVKTTRYVGRNGNINHGATGSRCYAKQIGQSLMARLEMQYNRAYLLKRQITYESLPLTPDSFPVFDKLVILDRFTERGVRNYARGILRKKGIKPTDPDYRAELRKEEAYVRSFVLGGKRGAYPAVHKHIARLKELNKEYGLTINYRTYFKHKKSDLELINCLIDIGKEEELCSKRMIMVETEKNERK